MEDEIDDDALAAMLAEDEETEEKNEEPPPEATPVNLSFADQAETMTREQLIALACSLVDKPVPTRKTSTYKISNVDMAELFGSKTENSPQSSNKPSSSIAISQQIDSHVASSMYIDPKTGIRIDSLNYTTSEIKSKVTLTQLIPLSQIDKQLPPMPTEWCTMAVLASKSDVKQSANGSTYSIWRLTDFKITINMFLFGDAHQSLWKTNLSSVLLIYDADTKKTGQLSIKQGRNISILGSNPDLSQCKAKAKSGEQCKNLVDRHACEYCVTHAHQIHKSGYRNNDKFNAGNMSRMNLQSTGSFVPKKYAAAAGGAASSPWSSSSKSTAKKRTESSASKTATSGNGLNTKEKSMLVMLGIEDDPLICVRTQDAKGLGDSMADVRAIYETKQAASKTKRVAYDETKHRDEPMSQSHIRSFPMVASTSPERTPESPRIALIAQSASATKSVSSPKQYVNLAKPASSAAINSAKQRAIDILKQRLAQQQITPSKGQSLVAATAVSPKRSVDDVDTSSPSKRLKINNSNPIDQKHFADVMDMKSTHADIYSQMSLNEMFERYQKKENIEEKLLQVMERDIKVVVCRQCHYTAYQQSILCKRKQHFVKICQVKQKFFECVQCHQRVFTWSQYPTENCRNCQSLKGFRRTALIRERHGAKFEDEILVLRGEEEKFLNSFVSCEKLPGVVD